MEDQIQEQAEQQEENSELGFWSKFGNIIANPRKTFESLDKRPTWLIPMLILVLIIVITTQIMFPVLIEKQLEMLKDNPNIAAEQLEVIENQMTENMNVQRIITLVSQLIITPLVFYLLLSFIFYFAGSVILGGDATFKKVLAVFSWSTCILIISSFVSFPLGMVKGAMDVSLSPALLLGNEAIGTTIHTLLSKFDFFIIWFLAVFAAGFAVIYRFSMTKAYLTVGLLWGIWIAVSTAFANIFKQFGM